ncbi:CheW protein [Denitrovibrio acetiphilus DSM 12809]|uniref:CheW protein n=1 Tax=Denitrovibrio acetiphilus (strain DSM 12809 / NBRC 114555 / N2460) TaxID=522772 RepID=D4H849_DENA2|nr:chemotaxis protein CheW [Denitrovibrio acetiphilus]ADD68198.1 CheW protein [Denitrovibrio acetiphilus DSM 12809]
MAEYKQYVNLLLNDEKYGIDIMDIKEILRMLDITKVPKAPSFVEGIINIRGKVIPIVDLRKKMGIPANEFTNSSRIIVVNLNGKQVGFIVDQVEEVLRVDGDLVDKAPAASTSVDNRYIKGVARLQTGMVIILDVHEIFGRNEASALSMF